LFILPFPQASNSSHLVYKMCVLFYLSFPQKKIAIYLCCGTGRKTQFERLRWEFGY